MRLVYDCSCRQLSQTPSLNDCLVAGPSLLNDIPALLPQFRLHQFAVSTDIEKAFLHVGLAEEDRDFTRSFWLHDTDDPDGPMDIYQFKVVLFGATSSSFMLHAAINKQLSDATS